jgi:hypothetical protein
LCLNNAYNGTVSKRKKKERIDPSPPQKRRILNRNAGVCCVCKRRGIGVHLHHIDGDNSNTVDENLAVLCVEDHDAHHRPNAYVKPKHLELGARQIRGKKQSWEAFVAEARKPTPNAIATLACYGTTEVIHSLELVLQWPDERIEHRIPYHLLDGDLDRLTDRVFEDLAAIGPNLKLAYLDQPLPVEHCPCCGHGVSRTLKPAVVARLTDPTWATDSSCGIYVNPMQPSLALTFFLREQELFHGSLHRCRGTFLHYHSDGIDDRVAVRRRPSVRTQAERLVGHILREWQPAKLFIGTGDHENPHMIDRLQLPECWDRAGK